MGCPGVGYPAVLDLGELCLLAAQLERVEAQVAWDVRVRVRVRVKVRVRVQVRVRVKVRVRAMVGVGACGRLGRSPRA